MARAAGVAALVASAHAQIYENPPAKRELQPGWLQSLKGERMRVRAAIGWQGGVFATPALNWTSTAYIQPQMHPYDQFFYNVTTGTYTPDKFLGDLQDRYGGIDAMLMWPTYTNIGADDRNMFDMFRCMPGGLDGVRSVIEQVQSRGVRVLVPYMVWDQGTRREPVSDEEAEVSFQKQLNANGINGDTMTFVPKSFWTTALANNYPYAFEPEKGGSDQALDWSTMGWGYWVYPTAPVTDRLKFITGGKFMTNVCDRWAKDRTNHLQSAWFNGDGYESWENVWGMWNGITPRDGEAIRRVGAMSRFFGPSGHLTSPDWEPHAIGPVQELVFGSRFPLDGTTLWTLVNRNNTKYTGAGLKVPAGAKHYYDCYHGVEIAPKPTSPPTVPVLSSNWSVYYGANSYSGHGGKDIDADPVVGLTLPECAARCDSNPSCDCFTYLPASGSCWRRAQCSPQYFDYNTDYMVYMRATGYSTYVGMNSYTGHGGTDIDANGTVKGAADCKAWCDSTPDCSCVTTQPSTGLCWRRRNCSAAGFQSFAGYTVYVNEARRPNPFPTPAPAASYVELAFDIEARGYGCVLETQKPASGALKEFLSAMKAMTSSPLGSFSGVWKYLPQQMVAIGTTKLASAAPAGMVHVPKGTFDFAVKGVEIEGDDAHGVDVQYPWEDHPMREHSYKSMPVGPFYMHKYPVTCANYSAYLAATGYRPKEPFNWLKNWGEGVRVCPSGMEDLPVTYVGLREARLYCRWAGGRLPHSYEWQYAAQGTDGRLYPWGSSKDQSKYPVRQSGNVFPGPEPVAKYSPGGDSPFGVASMVGNVWQYTDEFQDDHTRAVVVRGGSNYRPIDPTQGGGNGWYFPQALELNTHNKYMLMDDTYERAGTIGFRCVVDSAQ